MHILLSDLCTARMLTMTVAAVSAMDHGTIRNVTISVTVSLLQVVTFLVLTRLAGTTPCNQHCDVGCLCNAGYFGSPASSSGVCAACSPGTYLSRTTNGVPCQGKCMHKYFLTWFSHGMTHSDNRKPNDLIRDSIILDLFRKISRLIFQNTDLPLSHSGELADLPDCTCNERNGI